jgi:glycosyltransferase involved in cell wall biosynthesis
MTVRQLSPPGWRGQSVSLPHVPPNPLISVCITNHNYAQFLRDAIESVLAQSYPRVELVVVDDGSTDDSRRVIDRYGDRLVPIFRAQSGQAVAGWAGMQASSGDVIVFLDADDTLQPEICARVAHAFEREPDLTIVQWMLDTIDGDGRPLGRTLPRRPGLLPSGDLSGHLLRVRDWQYQLTSGVAYATWAARRILPADLPPGERHALDHWLNELAPLLGPIRSLDEVGGSHRVHGESFSGRKRSQADWSRRLITLTLNTHEHVRRLASELGHRCPEDARELRDPAFLGWRLVSLRIEPDRHPFPSDRRLIVAARGIAASVRHPHFPWPHRLKRVAWFAAVGTSPRAVARWITARYPANGPVTLPRR